MELSAEPASLTSNHRAAAGLSIGVEFLVTHLTWHNGRGRMLIGVGGAEALDPILEVLDWPNAPPALRISTSRWYVRREGEVEMPGSYPGEISIGLVEVDAPGPADL